MRAIKDKNTWANLPKTAARSYFRIMEDALFPPVCVFCGRILPKETDESAAFFAEELRVCRRCLAVLPLRNPADRRHPCLSNPYSSDPIPGFQVIVPFRYEEPVVTALRALKFHDAPYLGRTLSFFLAEAVRMESGEFDAVIPIPLSSERQRKRGYNQAAMLAEPLARAMNLPCPENFLVRTRNTSQQSRFIDPNLRCENVRDAFTVPDSADVSGLSILLLDDVSTTGSTLHEAAWTLYRNGARHVAGIAAASGRGDDRLKSAGPFSAKPAFF